MSRPCTSRFDRPWSKHFPRSGFRSSTFVEGGADSTDRMPTVLHVMSKRAIGASRAQSRPPEACGRGPGPPVRDDLGLPPARRYSSDQYWLDRSVPRGSPQARKRRHHAEPRWLLCAAELTPRSPRGDRLRTGMRSVVADGWKFAAAKAARSGNHHLRRPGPAHSGRGPSTAPHRSLAAGSLRDHTTRRQSQRDVRCVPAPARPCPRRTCREPLDHRLPGRRTDRQLGSDCGWRAEPSLVPASCPTPTGFSRTARAEKRGRQERAQRWMSGAFATASVRRSPARKLTTSRCWRCPAGLGTSRTASA